MAGTLRTDICERIQVAAGTVIADRYVLLELLGTGSYGEVWRASDGENDLRSVAVKLLRQSACNDAANERFKREILALGLLRRHRHIVELLDHGRHDGQLYMVMEYLSGGSLASYLKSCRAAHILPELSQVWPWFDQVCQSLGAAHQLIDPGPIVHRDINPNNIMIVPEPDGKQIIKVVDFGVARLGKRHQTHTGEPVGTRGYMSPEQAAGDCELIHPSSDVFALGLLLLEMLTLRVSAPEGQPFASVAIQSHKWLRAILPQLRADVPPRLWRVIAKALQSKVACRYSDAEHLRLAIAEALHPPFRPTYRRYLPALPGVVNPPTRDQLTAAR